MFWQWKQPAKAFCKICVLKHFCKFHRKTPMLDWVSPESLFNNVASLFQEKVILKNICERQTASVANTTNSQNFIIICLKGLRFYFTTMCWTLQLAALLKTNSVIDVFVSWKFAANQQMNRTPSVLWNAIDQSCKQLLYQIQAPLSIINVKLFWNFDSDKRKMFSVFYPALHEIFCNSCRFPLVPCGFNFCLIRSFLC